MKYLLNDYLFINGYKIQDDKIIVDYESGSATYDYSRDLEILILEEMKRQVLIANNKINESEKRLKKNRLWFYYNMYFMAYNTYMSFHDSKALHITLASLFLILNCFYASIINIDKERIKELKKYMYFINHEEEINSYIKEKFIEDYQNSTSFNPDEIPYITINDIENTSIKELEERVELIRMEKEQKLIQTKKA